MRLEESACFFSIQTKICIQHRFTFIVWHETSVTGFAYYRPMTHFNVQINSDAYSTLFGILMPTCFAILQIYA